MRYNKKFENFIDGVDFTSQDSCVWIVYPAGAAGDLLATIVNFHYGRTSCHYFGINDLGRVIFRASDEKIINLKYVSNSTLMLTQDFINDVNTEIGKKNLNYSLLDQLIFSNHAYQDQQVSNILEFFPNAKIIRISPKNTLEQNVIHWLSNQKNLNQIDNFYNSEPITNLNPPTLHNPRLLEIFFSDILNHERFENVYSKIIEHLDLDYKLIRFEFIENWLNLQHDAIKPILKTI